MTASVAALVAVPTIETALKPDGASQAFDSSNDDGAPDTPQTDVRQWPSEPASVFEKKRIFWHIVR